MKSFIFTILNVSAFCLASISAAILALHGIGAIREADAAVSFEKLPVSVTRGDFVVGPGRQEIEVDPGKSAGFEIEIANRIGVARTFKLATEDMKGSDDTLHPVILLGDDRGPNSLKGFVNISSTTVTVPSDSKVRIPVTIAIPTGTGPGGLYGSIIVSEALASKSDSTMTGISPVVTRVGVLVFVRVKGTAKESGRLEKFTIGSGQTMYWAPAPVPFELLFRNDGSVNLDPSATIDITNTFGKKISSIAVDPWFALPGSLRLRELVWQPGQLFGRYTAHVTINRGYGAAVDEASIVFWVLPWKVALGIFISFLVIIAGIWRVITRRRRLSTA